MMLRQRMQSARLIKCQANLSLSQLRLVPKIGQGGQLCSRGVELQNITSITKVTINPQQRYKYSQ
jgi:hypothetical protein